MLPHHNSVSEEGPPVTPLSESTQKEQTGGEAAADLLQLHHREHARVLHHCAARWLYSSWQEEAAEGVKVTEKTLFCPLPSLEEIKE